MRKESELCLHDKGQFISILFTLRQRGIWLLQTRYQSEKFEQFRHLLPFQNGGVDSALNLVEPKCALDLLT